ncbi:PD-(D/E)XK nuclease family protein [Archangium lipolyticum]|uniref:PD-(D/E)XK nuclease family protein n=1 Tax=Archangium lipolyticum TaxID=2970465 RepID=UPI00214A655B|nr:PD-(D/E)XK nuclease family protein [Archangium lipolyticum]
MSSPRRTLQVFPDAGRRQAALRAARGSSGIVRGDAFLTWDGFLEALGGARELGRRPCSPVAARTVVASLAQGLGSTPFGDFVHEPAFARAALEVLLDLEAGRLSPRELQDALEVLPPERRNRVRTLALLHHAYEQKMAELALADREHVVRGAREALERNDWPAAWDDVGTLVLHGIYDVRPSKLELLMALAAACDARRVTLRVETPVGGSPVADAALAALFRAFENRGEALPHVDLFKADVTFEARPMAELGRHLFSPRAPKDVLQGEVEGLRMWSAGTARDEARLIARDVRRLVSEGVSPGNIVVAWRDLGAEARWVADAFSELGVPVRLPWGEPLALAGPVRLALDLPLLVEDGFPAERVAELVSSRYAPILSRGAPEAPATLLTLAAVRDDRLGAARGKGAYDLRLEALAKRLEPLPNQVRPREQRRAHEARVLRERCLFLLESCRRIPEQGKASELLAAWWQVVGRLGLLDSEGALDAPADEGLGALALDARARDDAARLALVARVRELERTLAAVGGGPRLRRRTFGRWLQDMMRDVHLPARGPSTAAVEVLDVRELEGRSFGHVFLGGMAEGRFPGSEPPNPLLGDAERIALNKHLGRDVFRLTGGEFEDRAPWRLTEDRLLFASVLAAAEETVSLSFSVEGPGGQEQAPSAFLEEVRRLTGTTWEARSLPAIVPLDEVLTEPELRQRVVLESLALEKLRVSAPDPARNVLRSRFTDAPWLASSKEMVQVEIERLHFFGDTRKGAGRYTGAVDDPALGEAVRDAFRFGPERPLSASALARFGNCGFQGFLSYGLKVPEPEQPGEEFDRRGQGVFWHRVLEEFFKRLKERKLLGRGLDEIPEALLDTVLDEVRAHFEERHYVGHPALWRLARERAKNMVRRILMDERRGLPFERFEPKEFELRFGPRNPAEGWNEVTLQVDEDVIHFEGTIDRLDMAGGEVGVIDYKSGKLSRSELKKKLLDSDFQLPLYLYAARASGHLQTRQAAWFSLRTGEVIHLSEVLEKDAVEMDELLSTEPKVRERLAAEAKPNLANAVEALIRTVRAGQFAMRPKDCGSCGYRPVCRITERRLVEEEGSYE